MSDQRLRTLWDERSSSFIASLRQLKGALVNVGLGPVLSSEPARRVRKILFQTRLDDVVRIAEALDHGDVSWWLTGGWGLDGLIGTQTRRHEDVDMCIDVSGDGEQRAVRQLGDLGYQLVQARARGGRYLPVRCVLRNRAGKAIDLLMVQRIGVDALHDPQTGWPVPFLAEDDTTVGRIEGHQFPVLSVAAQLDARSVYEPKRRDYHDMAQLCGAYDIDPPDGYHSRRRRVADGLRQLAGRFRTGSAIIIPVPEARAVVENLRTVDSGLPPHITVLFPFKKPRHLTQSDADKLAQLARSMGEPIPFDLSNVGDFSGLMYLSPIPSDPFVSIVETAMRLWPDHPPYGGEFVTIVPHLTLGVRDLSPVEVDDLAQGLPVSAVVTELQLYTLNRRGRWKRHSRFPLGAR